MIILLDAGNTRCKWTQWHRGKLGSISYIDQCGKYTTANLVRDLLKASPDRLIIASVRGQEFDQGLKEELIGKGKGVMPEFVTTSTSGFGVRVAYPHPETLGVDRFVAMIGAHSRYRDAKLVIECGTAVTIDGLTSKGKHMGGLIFPGPHLMQESLTEAASGIGIYPIDTQAPLFAQDTASAVSGGVLRTVAAAIDTIAEDMEKRFNEPVNRILSGGCMDLLDQMLVGTYIKEPNLIFQGLAEIAGSRH